MFEESEGCLTLREDVYVISDEAHRTNYLHQKTDRSGIIKKSFGLIIREALPNANFMGFTGTPISKKDKSTREVFGDYTDVYNMAQSVADGSTCPIYYESRGLRLDLDESVLFELDEQCAELLGIDEEQSLKTQKRIGRLGSILGAEQPINSLCVDVVNHYENHRSSIATGKAMVVAYSRSIALSIYKKMIELRPDWHNKVRVVMTENNSDPEDWRSLIGNKQYREELSREFKDESSEFKIAIVVDMWLTGFDVPSMATMYIYKQMVGHSLMQAIARVNRVYPNKSGGLVVDYVGIAPALEEGLNEYASGSAHTSDISRTAYPEFVKYLEICRGIMFGWDYSIFLNPEATDLVRSECIIKGANFLSDVSRLDEKNRFIKHVVLMRRNRSICGSILTPEQRAESAYFEVVRSLLIKVGSTSDTATKELSQSIKDLLNAGVKSEGVIGLFEEIGGYSLFDPAVIERMRSKMGDHLMIQLMSREMESGLSDVVRINLAKSELFSERMKGIMEGYIKGLLASETVIQMLIELAQDITDHKNQGVYMGLTPVELAFWDALNRPEGIKAIMTDEVLIALTRELTATLNEKKTVDWNNKSSAKASMRLLIKRLLKKYKYPPDQSLSTTEFVLKQCELWAEGVS